MKYILSKHRGFTAALLAALCSALFALGLCFFAHGTALAEEESFDLLEAVVAVSGGDENADTFYYTGKEILPTVEVKLNGNIVDPLNYDIAVNNAIEPGVATITIKGKEVYSGTIAATFKIKYKNEWITPPSIVEWVRGGYKVDTNIITAEAKYGNDNLHFSIYRNNGLPIVFNNYIGDDLNKIKFTLDNDGLVPEFVANTLRTLDVGTYYLVGHVEATEIYSGINVGMINAEKIGNSFYIDAPAGSWQTPPSLLPWTWQCFDRTVNTITCVPAKKYIENKEVNYKEIVYGIYTLPNYNDGYAVKGLESFKTVSGSNVNDMVDIETGKKLAALSVGTYYLRVHVSYENSAFNMDTFVSFRILQIQNYWKVTPRIVEWSWNDYNPEINTISAIPHFCDGDSQVTFGIFTSQDCSDMNAVENLAHFNGVGQSQMDALASLKANTYWLKASFLGSSNYTGLETIITFNVRKNENAWLTSPYVLGWEFGGYSKERNKIFAEAKFGTGVFSIYTDEACGESDALEFSQAYNGNNKKFILEKDGLVPDYVTEKLKSLVKGKYYLLVECEGSTDFDGINTVKPIPFEVSNAENYWITAPGLQGWNESHFDIKVNNIIGTAKFGNVKYEITDSFGKLLFAISVDGKDLSVVNGDGISVEITDLNLLKVGTYTIKATVEGTDNYSGLSITSTFAVFEDAVGLTGIIAAAIVFAVLDVLAAAICITFLIIRRKKVEEQFREMVRKELGRR